MRQKIIYILYLTIGINCLIFSSCSSKEIEYKLDVKITYKNNSSFKLKYYEYVPTIESKVFLFEILPMQEKIFKGGGGGGGLNLSTENCCNGKLSDFQGDNNIVIEYENLDKSVCKSFINGTGSTSGNYDEFEKNKIDDYNFEISYSFTDEMLNQGIECD